MKPSLKSLNASSLAAFPVAGWIERRPDVLLALVVTGLAGMLVIPLPTVLLDGLIAVNIALSLVVLLVAVFASKALDVSSFPSLLLVTTLFRLGLNISTTRGILAHAEAGEMVRAFGEFVVAGDFVVGFVIFLVVTLVQFMVVGKGAERVAEVGARFTLDAMPGKQMSVDAAVRSGALTEEEGQDKRDEIQRASQMFGNMDGAMKFVKGDAVAGLVITVINLLGGLLIGVLKNGMSVAEAIDLYATLTIGDALIAQVGSMLVTLAAGMLVTRVEAKDKSLNLGFVVKDEVFGNPKVLFVAAGLMTALALVPGLPFFPFILCALAASGWGVSRMLFPSAARSAGSAGGRALEQFKEKLEQKVEEAKQQKSIADCLSPTVVPISIDLDPALSAALQLADDNAEDSDLVKVFIPQLRDALYLETGVRFPGVRVRPGIAGLPESSFQIRIHEVPVLQEQIKPGRFLATVPPEKLERLAVEAEPVLHPVSQARMSLVKDEDKEVVEAAGITVWNPSGVMALYLASALRQRAKVFIGLQEVAEVLARLEKTYPALVREVVPKVTSLQQLVGVLRRLVDERVSIRNMKGIIEALGEFGDRESEVVWLTEKVRAALAHQLAHAYVGLDRRLHAVLLDETIEETIEEAIQHTSHGPTLSLEPELSWGLVQSIAKALQPVVASGKRPIVLTRPTVRRFVRLLLETDLPNVAVLSFDELPPQVTVQPVGRAELAAA